MDKLSVEEAAKVLGIKEESVRKRVSRGTLDAEKDPDGRIRVWVDTSVTNAGTVRDEYGDPSVAAYGHSELVEAQRDEIAHLRRESERKDAIIMSLSQSNAELSRTIRALEAPQETPPATPGASESVEEGGDRGHTPQEQERPVERPWWRKVFGGGG